MRLFAATSLLFLTARPAVTHGFHVAGRPAVTRSAVTSLDARRSLFPVLRRGFAFPDVDRVFDEMDELMETSFSTRFPRPALSPTIKGFPEDLRLRRPLGFDVTQDDKQYKVAVHVPDVSAEDVDLQLDHDGRVLRLKGERSHEEGGMKVCSRFEKAILLSPDVDTTKLAANMSGDTLTVVAPKIEKKEALDHAENKKIEIKVVGAPEAALQDDTPKAPTRLAVENLKHEEKVESKPQEGEAKWPARDFPY